jgi:hypothetical protein
MPVNLSAKPFWLAGEIKALRMKERIIRFTATPAAADPAAVNTATLTKRMGATNANLVLNRGVWMDTYDTGSDIVLGFTSIDEVADVTYALQSNLNVKFRIPASGPSTSDYANYADVMATYTSRGLLRRAPLAPVYIGNMTLRGGGDFAVDASGLAAAGGHNITVADYAGFPRIDRWWLNFGVPANFNEETWKYLVNGLSPTNWGNFMGNYDGMSSTYHPGEATVRSIFSQASGTRWMGRTKVPLLKHSNYVRSGYVHGVHRNIRAIVLTADLDVKYIYALFTATEIADVIDQQATLHAEPVKTQLQDLATQVRSQGSTRFAWLGCADPQGPFDIYTMKKIAAAISDGADMADIDSYLVGGKRLDVWRAECNAMPGGFKALLWAVDRGGVLTSPEIRTSNTSPFFTVEETVAGGAYHVTDFMVGQIIAKSAGVYSTANQVIAALETATSATFVGDDGRARGLAATGSEVVRPWEDLPEVWLRRANMAGAQPVANVLYAALTEPAAAFGYDPIP